MDGWLKLSQISYNVNEMEKTTVEAVATGTVLVFYDGHLVALINDRGRIMWRDFSYPIFLVEYIINNSVPQSKWN